MPSVSSAEIEKFGKLAPRWWDLNGPMWPLHRMNPVRIGWIVARIGEKFGEGGVKLLDIGCGAGIAAEALARAGHDVLGMDASAEAIGVAVAHAQEGGVAVAYRQGLAEDLAAEGAKFAVITALEIIEHVPDQTGFLCTLAGLLEPGGVLVVSTLNRTLRSLAVGKIGAEYVARVLPAGTHDFRAFVKPDELASMGRQAGLRLSGVSGMSYDVPRGAWKISGDLSVNYIAAFSS